MKNRIHRDLPRLLFPILLLFFSAHCSSESTDSEPNEIVIGVAASLSDVMKEIQGAFEKEFPSIRIRISSAGSNTLVRQVERGAPIDIVALAAEPLIVELEKQHLLITKSTHIFATNRLCLIAPSVSEFHPTGLEDLHSVDTDRIAIASAGVPARLYTEEALRNVDVWDALKTSFVYGGNVRQVLHYVESGEVDFGIVYQTDAMRGEDISTKFVVPSTLHSPIRYPIAIVKGTAFEEGCRSFIEFLRGPKGDAILKRHGFGNRQRS